MAIDTFDELKLAINDYLNDDSVITSRCEEFISLAEERMHTRLRVREMLRRSQNTCSTTERYLALPERYVGMRVLRLLTNPVTRVQFVNEDEMTRQVITVSGIPAYFSVHEEIEFNRVCESAFTAELIYYRKPAALATATQSNAILTTYPSLYLYGSLVAAEPYLDNDERILVWKEFYETALRDANHTDMISRYPGALSTRVIGAHP